MRLLTSSDYPSPDRPSLLVRYLTAIGPGSILGLGSTHLDLRWDSTSHRLMTAALPQWAFVPIPFVPRSSSQTSAPRGTCEPDTKKSGFNREENFESDYAKIFPFHERFVQEFTKACKDPMFYKDLVDCLYTIPESGPLIILGNPRNFLGGDSNAVLHGESKEVLTPFEELLNDCGWSESFSIQSQSAGTEALIEHKKAGKKTILDPTVWGDLGLVYLSRTRSSSKRLVIIIAGAASALGTLAGVRLATDFGRYELNERILRFIDNPEESFGLVFNARWQTLHQPRFPFSPSSPISLHFENLAETQRSPYVSELVIRAKENDLAALTSRSATIDRETTLLGKYFRENGPVSILAKVYEEDISDDGTAINLLTTILPDSRFIPTPDSAPWQMAKTSVSTSNANVANDSSQQDPDFVRRAKWWRTIEEERKRSPKAFSDFVDRHYRIPDSGPLCLVGSPNSILGFSDGYGDASVEATALAKLMRHITYPNRYLLKYEKRSSGNLQIEDRMLGEDCISEEVTLLDVDRDAGVIYLVRGPDDRDILIIAGYGWLGTLAGTQLLFTERRPAIDRLVQEYVNGHRERVEIAFRCTRTLQTTKTNDDTSGFTLPISHPAVHLKVEILNEATLNSTFVYSHKTYTALAKFFDAWNPPDSPRQSADAEPGDKCIGIEYHAARSEMTIRCSKVYSISDCMQTDHVYFVSEPTEETLERLKNVCTRSSHGIRPIIILGPTGVGKEGTAMLVHHFSSAPGTFMSVIITAMSLNVAESEIFGHVRGAFTNATHNRIGHVETCKNGTIVFNECWAGEQELQDKLQPKFLDIVEHGRFQRVGESKVQYVNANFVFTTNETPTISSALKAVDSGKLRGDLFHRIPQNNKFELLPVKDRPLEILPAFIYGITKRFNPGLALVDGKTLGDLSIEGDALLLLMRYDFPGNFRELAGIADVIANKLGSLSRTITKQMMRDALLSMPHSEPADDPDHVTQTRTIRIRLELKQIQKFDLAGSFEAPHSGNEFIDFQHSPIRSDSATASNDIHPFSRFKSALKVKHRPTTSDALAALGFYESDLMVDKLRNGSSLVFSETRNQIVDKVLALISKQKKSSGKKPPRSSNNVVEFARSTPLADPPYENDELTDSWGDEVRKYIETREQGLGRPGRRLKPTRGIAAVIQIVIWLLTGTISAKHTV